MRRRSLARWGLQERRPDHMPLQNKKGSSCSSPVPSPARSRLGAQPKVTAGWLGAFMTRRRRPPAARPSSRSQAALVAQWVSADAGMKKQVKANLLATLGTQARPALLGATPQAAVLNRCDSLCHTRNAVPWTHASRLRLRLTRCHPPCPTSAAGRRRPHRRARDCQGGGDRAAAQGVAGADRRPAVKHLGAALHQGAAPVHAGDAGLHLRGAWIGQAVLLGGRDLLCVRLAAVQKGRVVQRSWRLWAAAGARAAACRALSNSTRRRPQPPTAASAAGAGQP